jgi:hypothetical protein
VRHRLVKRSVAVVIAALLGYAVLVALYDWAFPAKTTIVIEGTRSACVVDRARSKIRLAVSLRNREKEAKTITIDPIIVFANGETNRSAYDRFDATVRADGRSKARTEFGFPRGSIVDYCSVRFSFVQPDDEVPIPLSYQ